MPDPTLRPMSRLLAAGIPLLGLIAACEASRTVPDVGDPVPPSVAGQLTGTELEGPSLVWVFDTEDCFKCQTFFRSLREVQRDPSRSAPRFVALHLGRVEDLGDVERTIARERISYLLKQVSPAEIERIETELVTPVALALKGGLILAAELEGTGGPNYLSALLQAESW